MKAALYLRISQDRTGEELGVTRQREACEQLADRRGWQVHRVYVDNDASAAGGKHRPEWEAMMTAVESGDVGVVVGWTIDRTLRTGRDRLRMLEAGKARGITISLVRGSDMDLSTPAGRLAADILGAVALNEIEVKSDRQKAAHEQAARMGRRFGGRRPFGYEQDGMTPRPAEAKAVTAAFEDYLAGTSIIAISRRWNNAGLLSGVSRADGTPTRWDHSGVRAVLRNPRYCGMRAHKGEVVSKAAWPPLVDESTWRAVNAVLASSAAETKPRGGRRLLTGLARCGVCGEGVVCGGNKKGAPPVYRCPSGSHVTRRSALVDDRIGKLVVARVADREVVERLAAAEHGDAEDDLTAEAERLRAEMDTIARERAQRIITPRQFGLMNAELLAQLATVERQMTTTRRRNGVSSIVGDGLDLARWKALEIDERRALIAGLMSVRLWSGGRGVKVPAANTIQVRWAGEVEWWPTRTGV